MALYPHPPMLWLLLLSRSPQGVERGQWRVRSVGVSIVLFSWSKSHIGIYVSFMCFFLLEKYLNFFLYATHLVHTVGFLFCIGQQKNFFFFFYIYILYSIFSFLPPNRLLWMLLYIESHKLLFPPPTYNTSKQVLVS